MKSYEKVQKWLDENGITQRELADRVGMTEVSMSRFLRSKRLPHAPYMANIASVMGIDNPWDLIKDDYPEKSPVGGVDRSEKVDKISLPMAVETPFWMAVWAAEPERMVDVRMSYSDLKIICDMIDERHKCSKWIYSADGRPDKEGIYWCVLLYDEWEDGKRTGRKRATVDTRYFGDIADDVARTWVMDNEPETGLVWTEETGSYDHEQVWAWRPTLMDDPLCKDIKLPYGVEWGDEE